MKFALVFFIVLALVAACWTYAAPDLAEDQQLNLSSLLSADQQEDADVLNRYIRSFIKKPKGKKPKGSHGGKGKGKRWRA